MEIEFTLNGKVTYAEIKDDTSLFDLLRAKGCYSVKCGCETENCGLCTVLVDGKSVLSCSMLAARVDDRDVVTLEGVQKGAEQCGFCSPGLIMNVLAMEKELVQPEEDAVREYLAGNLCRCSGYMGQMRAIRKYLARGGEAR